MSKLIDKKTIKSVIRNWLLEIEKEENIPVDIVAISFNLYEPYGLEVVGSKWFDKNDEDWACEEDFVPQKRHCPTLKISDEIIWVQVLEAIIFILKELLAEHPKMQLFQVKYIAVGFVDGNLHILKE